MVAVATGASAASCGGSHHPPTSSPSPTGPALGTQTTEVDWCVYDKKKHTSFHVTITAIGTRGHTEPGPCTAGR